MQVSIGAALLALHQGDITQQHTDAIVNAANSGLLGGSSGSVDGAIHRAGGPAIMAACRKLERPCAAGDARITEAGDLPASYVIHAVGPIYHDDPSGAATVLARAYQRSLELASQQTIHSIAFPSISTGAYGYPVEQAAPIALSTVIGYLHHHADITLVRFVLFDSHTFAVYRHSLEALVGTAQEGS